MSVRHEIGNPHPELQRSERKTDTSPNRLHGPIGIYIGSKTPAEIAVSVMAEILAEKNSISLPKEHSIAQRKKNGEKLIKE